MISELKNSDDTNNTSYWDQLIRPRPYILASLLVIGLFLQIYIFYYQNISAAYTHFFYIVIVLAGLWYQKKAIYIAIFFSILYLVMEFIPPYSLSVDSVFRAIMLYLVAIIVGSITERMIILQKRLHTQNIQLQESHNTLEIGNKKLNMLSSITRHDILNQLMVLRNYLEFAKEIETDPVILKYMEKEDTAAEAIEKQITFTKYYQDIGIQVPAWQDVEEYIKTDAVELRIVDIPVDIACSGLEVYADPLIKKVFYNLMENSLRHGG